MNDFCFVFVAILFFFLVLLMVILYLFCNMMNKKDEYKNTISYEISKLSQTVNCSMSTFREFSNRNNKCYDYLPNNNECLIKLYYYLAEIQDNIKTCYNSTDKNINDFVDGLFKFQSNHIKVIDLLHSVHYSDNTKICELLDQFEDAAKKKLLEYNNSGKKEDDKMIKEIEQKLNHYMMMLKDLLNLK